MNLNYCKTYLEVVKRGSFSEAAKALGLSQPTVSFQIQRLEADLSAELLERQGGRVVLTAAGKEFLAFAERVTQEQTALQEHLAALQGEVVGALELGASTNPGEQIVPNIIGAFRRRYPKVSATVMIADTAEIVAKVLDRQCDAGFVGADIRHRGLATRKIAEDKLLLIATPDHPIARQPQVRLEDLEKDSFVVREVGSGTQKTIEELMLAHGFSPHRLKIAMVAGSNQAVVTAVEAGVGLGFVSQQAAARSLELGRVRAIPVQGVAWVRGIYFIHPKAAPRTRLFEEFLRFLDEWTAARAEPGGTT